MSLLKLKRLDELPVRIQRFRIRLFRFHYDISHTPGSFQISAAALSRAPVMGIHSVELQNEVEDFSVGLVSNLQPSSVLS